MSDCHHGVDPQLCDICTPKRQGCGKARYSDKRAAQSQINLSMQQRGRHGRAMTLRAYHCPSCGFYHLTKSHAR